MDSRKKMLDAPSHAYAEMTAEINQLAAEIERLSTRRFQLLQERREVSAKERDAPASALSDA